MKRWRLVVPAVLTATVIGAGCDDSAEPKPDAHATLAGGDAPPGDAVVVADAPAPDAAPPIDAPPDALG